MCLAGKGPEPANHTLPPPSVLSAPLIPQSSCFLMGLTNIGYTYQYNLANQRTRVTLADSTSWAYGYDNLGQVTSGRRSWQDGTPVAGQQFEYAFDDIGNRLGTAAGGGQRGAGLRPALYSPNHLNQYESRTVPGTIDITGIANPTAAVTVNGSNAVRQGEYFWQPVTGNNTNAAQYLTNLVASAYGSGQSATGSVFIARTPEAFSYDPDGNLTNDGRWNYTWDGENRLSSMTANTSVGPQQRVVFQYDWQGRRIHKQVWPNTAGTGTPILDELFIYDGWNLLAILTANSSLLTSFTWGLDLSGSMQGAGGVGGLLSVSQISHSGGITHCSVAACDGNGNVAALVNAADGSISARYEYGPFGELLRATGPMAKANPFRFSTKYQDDETDLLDYGYRYYCASIGRWLSEDPLGTVGGRNLYCMVANNPTDDVDPRGLSPHLPNGTVLTQEAEVGGRGGNKNISAAITGTFSPEEQATAKRALCLVNALIGPGLHPVPWPDTYWANITPDDIFGVNFEYPTSLQPKPTPAPKNGDKWITISRQGYPTATSGTALLIQMKNFGGTLAHEADHYDTGSSEDTAKAHVDTPLADMFVVAKAQRLKCVWCKTSPSISEHWRVQNMLEFFACQCGIKVR